MPQDFEVRAFQKGDEQGLVDLFGRCFGRQSSLAHWTWKMQPCETDFDTMWLAVKDGRPVGQYVGTPIPIWINGKPGRGIAIFDTMVDPSMRRKGVLTAVGSAAHQHWQDSGIQLGFGLPNQQWGSRAAALGWIEMFPLNWLVRVLRPEAILARRTKIGALKHATALGAVARKVIGRSSEASEFRFENFEVAPESLDKIAESWRCNSSTQIARGRDWVQKRYLNCPSADYRLVLGLRDGQPFGFAIYRVIDGDAHQVIITEVITVEASQNPHNALVTEIERQSLELGVETIRTLAVPGKTNYQYFREAGFIEKTPGFTLQLVPFDDALKARKALEDWDFQPGDFDVV